MTSADVLIELAEQLEAKGVGLWIGGMHSPARAFAERAGLAAALGDGHIQLSVDLAVRAAEQTQRP